MQRQRIFKQSSGCWGSGIDLSLMGAQEQFHLKIKTFLSEKIPVFKVIGKSRQQDRARHEND